MISSNHRSPSQSMKKEHDSSKRHFDERQRRRSHDRDYRDEHYRTRSREIERRDERPYDEYQNKYRHNRNLGHSRDREFEQTRYYSERDHDR